ncbi:MAG TPA: prenyltransferase/squalene oxidase repeat-containing protein [Humisphaera sp.]|nr:prenyltransferase/squalene oxidase repeat-containing protein [Humisphaera sp.]
MKSLLTRHVAAIAFAASLAAPTLLLPDLRADDAPKHANAAGIADLPSQVRGDEINAAQQASVEKGLAWLAARQKDNAAYGTGIAGYGNHAGITALAGLAFMQAGNLPGRGKYGKEVQHCLDFVLQSCQESGLIASDAMQGPMYGHGFATLFLAEVYGMTGDESIKEKLQKAVRLIEKTQNPEGGWRYQPVPYDADLSVTICEIMGLRAARDAGIKVEKDVIDKAIKYVRRCQNMDGGFSYMAMQGGGMGGSAFPRSAAGVCALYYAGVFEGHELERGLQYIQKYTAGAGSSHLNEGHFFYGYYYGTQAMFLAGGDYWAKFYPAIRDELIRRQEADHWTGDVSEDYATSMALIILQMPNRYLPVYSGKGPGS